MCVCVSPTLSLCFLFDAFGISSFWSDTPETSWGETQASPLGFCFTADFASIHFCHLPASQFPFLIVPCVSWWAPRVKSQPGATANHQCLWRRWDTLQGVWPENTPSGWDRGKWNVNRSFQSILHTRLFFFPFLKKTSCCVCRGRATRDFCSIWPGLSPACHWAMAFSSEVQSRLC